MRSAPVIAPFGRLIERWKAQPANLRWFIGALCLAAVGGGLTDPAFNNYLRATFNLSAAARGEIEFPRELPGFLVAVTSGLLFFLPEVRTAALATAGMALGLAGLAWAGSDYALMVAFMVLQSAGMHLMMPMRSSISLSFARQEREATLLGQIGSVTTVASIFGAAATWWLFRRFTPSWGIYQKAFLVGAGFIALSALTLLRMRLPHVREKQPRAKLVVRKRYRLFYLLSIIAGARKQIFITFAPWVLITIFKQGPATFAALAIVSALLGIGFQPLLGRMIDRLGERVVLMTDGTLLVGVCIGYGFAHRLGTTGLVLFVVYGCFILDQMLFSMGMARTTYVSKIAEKREDLTATLSLGITLDHAVSMSIPMLGGATWVLFGVEYVFTGAAVLAVLSAVASSFVRVPHAGAPARPVLRDEVTEGGMPWTEQQPARTSAS